MIMGHPVISPHARGDVAVGGGEVDFPIVIADRVQVAALVEVNDGFAGALFGLALKKRQEVIAVQVHFEGFPVGLVPFFQFFLYIGHACSGQQGGHPVLLGNDVVVHGAGLDDAGPAYDAAGRESRLPRSNPSRRGMA
jgi:hypothetical protein